MSLRGAQRSNLDVISDGRLAVIQSSDVIPRSSDEEPAFLCDVAKQVPHPINRVRNDKF